MKTSAKFIQLVVFSGAPASLGQVARQVLRRNASTCFLCVLEPGQSAEAIYRAWAFSVQPLCEWVHLTIIREPANHLFEGIAEYAAELAHIQSAEMDLLFLSDEASWRGSRRIGRGLNQLRATLEKSAPGCVVRRV